MAPEQLLGARNSSPYAPCLLLNILFLSLRTSAGLECTRPAPAVRPPATAPSRAPALHARPAPCTLREAPSAPPWKLLSPPPDIPGACSPGDAAAIAACVVLTPSTHQSVSAAAAHRIVEAGGGWGTQARGLCCCPLPSLAGLARSLRSAASAGDLEGVCRLLRSHPHLVDEPDADGCTAL